MGSKKRASGATRCARCFFAGLCSLLLNMMVEIVCMSLMTVVVVMPSLNHPPTVFTSFTAQLISGTITPSASFSTAMHV